MVFKLDKNELDDRSLARTIEAFLSLLEPLVAAYLYRSLFTVENRLERRYSKKSRSVEYESLQAMTLKLDDLGAIPCAEVILPVGGSYGIQTRTVAT